MGTSMWEISKMARNMEAEYSHNQMGINILVNLNMIREMDKALLTGQTEINILVSSNMTNYTETE